MNTRLSFAILVALVALSLTFFSGCTDNSNATIPMSNSINTGDPVLEAMQNELVVMKAGGFDPTSGKGVFSIGWREMFNPKDQSSTLMGQAMAVGFDGTQTGLKGGVDMGTVYLNYGSNHLELQKRTGPQGGTAYSSAKPPTPGGGTPTSVGFISNASYEFEVTGSSKFSAIKTGLTAPAALLQLTSPSENQSISTSNDLAVSWSGGSTSSGVLVVIAAPPDRPAVGMQDGRGGMGPGGMQGPGGKGGMMGTPPPGGPHPPMLDTTRAIVVRLDSNTGSYTVAAAELQGLISKTHATKLMCLVSQLSAQEVDHDGGKIHLVLRNGDGARLTVQ